MNYKVDKRDVDFNLMEWLNVADICAWDAYKDHSAEMYQMILDEALKFSLNEVSPLNKVGDEEGCRLEGGQVYTPKGFKEAYAKFAQNGFVGLDVPTTYGGQNLPSLVFNAVYEVFNGANVPFTMYAALTRGSAFLIETFNMDKKLADLFCEKMYTGVWTGTMCLTEPGAGSAVGDLRTSAKKNDDGTYNITGSKIFISSGDHDLTDNIVHLVLARVEGDAPGTKGISLFVVPKIWVNEDGSLGEANDVKVVNIEHKMGIKASSTCTLSFGDEGKCRGYLLGEQSKGMKYMFQMMNEARLLCGAQGQSIAGTAYENAKDYAKERVQWGDHVLTDFPDVRRMLVTCKAFVEGMRGMLNYTSYQMDIAEHHPDETTKARAKNRTDLLTPICKAYCSDFGFKVTELAIQIYGGYGYCSEYPVEQYMRDVKISSIYEGTNGIQALDLVGRKMTINGGALVQEFYEDLSAFTAEHAEHAELKDEMAALKGALDTVGQVGMQFAQWGMGDDKNKVLLGATPYLEMCGHVMMAYVLLSQSVVAHEKADSGDEFYKNKIKTARFFVRNILPKVRMLSKAILSGDESALEITL
jgi:alkylation response protein AidB-like acyl-CoA dehydrogenase